MVRELSIASKQRSNSNSSEYSSGRPIKQTILIVKSMIQPATGRESALLLDQLQSAANPDMPGELLVRGCIETSASTRIKTLYGFRGFG